MSDRGLRVIKANAAALLLAAGGFALTAGGYALAADMPVKAPPVKETPFFIVNDTSVSFVYYWKSTDPGVAGMSDVVPGGVAGVGNAFARYQGSIDHFDVWKLGTNFIHAEFDQYGGQDPSLGIPGAQGSREFFAIARSTLGWNELTNSKAFTNYFIKDISFEIGGNAGVQDNFLDEHTTVGMAGLQFALNVPGTVNISLMAEKEFTRNAFDVCGPPGFGVVNGPGAGFGPGGNTCAGGVGAFNGNREFQWTWRVETFVSEPLTFLPGASYFPLTFVNIANVIGPKGTGISTANCIAVGCFGAAGAFNNNETKIEVFEDARLSLDMSKVVWNKSGIWDTFIGYRYWYNKFGTNHNAFLFSTIAPGTSIESTAYVGTTYHFK